MANPSFEELFFKLVDTVQEHTNLTANLVDRVIALEEKVKELEAPEEQLTFAEKYDRVRMK